MPLLFERQSGPTLTFPGPEHNFPRSVRLADGRILVLVQDNAMGHHLLGRFFDVNGNDTGVAFQVANHAKVTGIAALANGGFAIVFSGPDEVHDIFLEQYDSAGVLTAPAIQVNNPGGLSQTDPVIAVLAGGRLAVAWTNRDPSSADPDFGVAARILEADGTPVTGQFLVNQPPYGLTQRMPKIVALADGNFAIGWEGPPGAGGIQIFDPQGARIGAEIESVTTSMILLSNGNFVASGSTGARIFDPTGAVVATIPDPGPTQGLLVLGAVNGGFVARITNGTGPDTVIYDNLGVQQGVRFHLSDSDSFDQVQILANGGFLFSGKSVHNHIVETQVIRLDDGIVDIALSQGSVSEGTVLNSYIASVSQTLGALNGAYTFSVLSDSLGGAFRIDGDRLILDAAGLLDYEAATTVQITIGANDGYGNTFSETIQLNVIDESPEQAITGSDAVLTLGRDLASLPGGRTVSFLTTETGNNFTALGQLFDSAMNLIATFTVENDPAFRTHRNFDVAALPSGGFVVTWDAFNNNIGTAVQARIFDAAGDPVSGVLLVNMSTNFPALEPEVVALGSGRFLIAWEDSASDDVRAQVFSATGTKLGTEYALNSTLPGQQNEVVLQPLASGGFLATWTSIEGGSSEIRARLFDSFGVPLGADFVVNTTIPNDQVSSTVVALASGNLLVTWASRDSNSTTDDMIFGQLFDSAGARVGGELLLETLEDYDLGGRHRVVALPSGGFALAWTEVGAPPDSDGASVWARLFNANGSPASAAFLVNTAIARHQRLSDLSLLGNGELYVAWQEPTPIPPGARTFDLTGTRTDWSVDDVLFGSPDADTLRGGTGNDIYYVNHPGDVVIELPGQGSDIVYASVSWTLTANSEVELLAAVDAAATDPLNLTGNGLANEIVGNAGANQIDGKSGADLMRGLGGNDVYLVDNAGDQVIEASGGGANDGVYSSVSYALASGQEIETLSALNWNSTALLYFTGNEFANYLIGNAGDNVLNGGAGADVMLGRDGNDTYIVDHAGDQTLESIGGTGNDSIYTSVSYALAFDQEIETLATLDWNSIAALNLTGNDLPNYLIGNAGANQLDGRGERDVMHGLGGSDTYVVDDTRDHVVEASGGGVNDAIYTSVSLVLASDQEIETLSTLDWGSIAALNLTGNGIANYLIGNAGANVLNGGGGADVLLGRGGDDTYIVDNAGDQVFESIAGTGNDAIYTSVSYALASDQEIETLSTLDWGSTAALNLTGNELANYIIGNAGANVLDGKGGGDALYGRSGADQFAFTTALGGGNIDQIGDFVSGADKIGLDDAIFGGIGSPGSFNANAFVMGAAAQDADDRIVYNQVTGQLFYDADGNGAGAAVLFATLSGAPTLGASDFQVI